MSLAIVLCETSEFFSVHCGPLSVIILSGVPSRTVHLHCLGYTMAVDRV